MGTQTKNSGFHSITYLCSVHIRLKLQATDEIRFYDKRIIRNSGTLIFLLKFAPLISLGLPYIMKPETEVLFMKEQTYHIYLDSHEKTTLLHSLVELKNQLIQQGRYTDCVDELIFKVINAPVKRLRIEYV